MRLGLKEAPKCYVTQLFVQEESVVLNRKPKHTLNLTKIAKYKQVRLGFPGGSDGKESACNPGDLCSVPGSGRSPGEGKSNTFQHSYLENPMDRGAW